MTYYSSWLLFKNNLFILALALALASVLHPAPFISLLSHKYIDIDQHEYSCSAKSITVILHWYSDIYNLVRSERFISRPSTQVQSVKFLLFMD